MRLLMIARPRRAVTRYLAIPIHAARTVRAALAADDACVLCGRWLCKGDC
ncbi:MULTISPECIES: hypothetical protein [unclassified Streptomyces]|nr:MULTISPECIES: hypothetical protein [unclassified Streptomyces]MYZ40766.1 hypothetical protein [Streptomyces sp. SID4917]SCG08548.1 hypothetical protein GA0115259_113213 [Streptomyces sp. MnatMP-M17]